MKLQQSEIDYSRDGILMIPPTSGIFGRGVYHYVRTLAFASAATHETGEGYTLEHVVNQQSCNLGSRELGFLVSLLFRETKNKENQAWGPGRSASALLTVP
jgi:hypothetical protein